MPRVRLAMGVCVDLPANAGVNLAKPGAHLFRYLGWMQSASEVLGRHGRMTCFLEGLVQSVQYCLGWIPVEAPLGVRGLWPKFSVCLADSASHVLSAGWAEK